MKKLSIIFASCFATVAVQAQLVSSADIFISSGAIVTVNGELSNTGNFKSEGDLHLRKGLTNQGQMSLNGQVVMDGEGTQVIQSPIQLKAGTFVMSQMGKVVLRAPLFVEQQLILGDGILENNELNLLEIADNGNVTGGNQGGSEKSTPGTIDIKVRPTSKSNGGGGASLNDDNDSNGNGLKALTSAANDQMLVGRYDGAAKSYERAIQRGGDRGKLGQKLGICYERMGKKSDAIAAYREAKRHLESKSSDPKAKSQLDAVNQALKNLGG